LIASAHDAYIPGCIVDASSLPWITSCRIMRTFKGVHQTGAGP